MERALDHELATADGHDRYVPSSTKDIVAAGHEGVYEWAVANLVREGTTFLDLGCGTGYGSDLVVAAGARFDGVDGSPAAIDYATARYGGARSRFFVADLMEALPTALLPGSYDVVFSSEVLEHVVDPFAFVDVMATYLREDGTCFVGTPNRLWSGEHMPAGRLLARSHVMEFTPPALVALLRSAFDEVTLMLRLFPEGAIRSMVAPGRVGRASQAARALVGDVLPPRISHYADRVLGRAGAGQWSPKDIEWVGADDRHVDVSRAVGLAAICRGPRLDRRHPARTASR